MNKIDDIDKNRRNRHFPHNRQMSSCFKNRFILQAEIFSGKTDLEAQTNIREPHHSLAKIHIQLLSVDGFYTFNGTLKADAFLQNLVLEDSRLHDDLDQNSDRIVKLLEAKDNREKMIKIKYSQNPNGDRDVEVLILR